MKVGQSRRTVTARHRRSLRFSTKWAQTPSPSGAGDPVCCRDVFHMWDPISWDRVFRISFDAPLGLLDFSGVTPNPGSQSQPMRCWVAWHGLDSPICDCAGSPLDPNGFALPLLNPRGALTRDRGNFVSCVNCYGGSSWFANRGQRGSRRPLLQTLFHCYGQCWTLPAIRRRDPKISVPLVPFRRLGRRIALSYRVFKQDAEFGRGSRPCGFKTTHGDKCRYQGLRRTAVQPACHTTCNR